jgi:hypothetical protein
MGQQVFHSLLNTRNDPLFLTLATSQDRPGTTLPTTLLHYLRVYAIGQAIIDPYHIY